MAVDPTPGQTPPSLKNAAGLSGTFEFACIWTGQSNSRPWGYPADGFKFAQELDIEDTGEDLTGVVIPNLATRSVGMIEVLTVGTTLNINQWNTSTFLRLGTPTVPLKGYAQVIVNTVNTLRVKWLSLPTNNQTVAGYLVRENGKWASYEQVRVLTPYVPLQDIEPPPSGGGTTWFPPRHSPYPTPDAPFRSDGRRLILPAPYTKPTLVTTFDDLGLFLPLTRREGITGFGLSEIADSTFTGIGNPTGHPITTITPNPTTGDALNFENTVGTDADLTGGYVIVDWMSGSASKRSWGRIKSSAGQNVVVEPASWLGDGLPAGPASASVTFDIATDEVIWPGHGRLEGDRVFFTGSTMPAGITRGQVYRVRNVNGTDRFQVSASMGHSVIDIGAGAVGVLGVEAWIWTAWIPHWKDNPFAWIPGPEFAYPNEDQQPRGGYVHNRPRGQLLYVHQSNVELGGGTELTPFDGVADARFGAMLPFGWRVSSSLGKRINLVALGVNSAPLAPGAIPNFYAHLGIVGWWNYEQYGFGLPLEDSNSQMSKRLKRLITFIAPQALIAEGVTKGLRFLSACHIQGETDSLVDAAREIYIATITDFKEWLRDLTSDAGFSPFQGEAKMPFVQPLLTRDPWETTGQGTSFQTFGVDANGEVNNAIREAHTAEEFSDYTLTEDIPKLKYLNGVIDNAHFSGEGMSVQGARLAATALELLEHALSYSSTVLDSTNPRLLRIANLALLHLGESSDQIASLTENTAQAKLIATMLPEAILQLLSMRQWSWALRREPMTQVKHNNPKWLYAYVVPARAITPFAIFTAVDPDTQTTVDVAATGVVPPIALSEVTRRKPEPFEIGRSLSGHRLLFTNVPEIAGDVSKLQVADGKLHPERLPRRPTMQYVDKVIDPDRFSPSFATALTWYLASMLAPALIKSENGEAVAVRCLQRAAGFIRAEATHEAVTQQRTLEHIPKFIQER